MLDWYLRTHSWNRISLTGLIVAPVAEETIGALTLLHVIGFPIGAMAMWALGWVAIGGWNVLRRSCPRFEMLKTADAPIVSNI